MHCRNMQIGREGQKEEGGSMSHMNDLWVIIAYEYVCAHNEIYKLLQIPSLGFCSRCLMPQHVPLAFTKLTKCLLGHFDCPHPTGLMTKYCNTLLTSGLMADLTINIIVKESLKVWKSLEQLWVQMKARKPMVGMKLHVTAANLPANTFMRKFHMSHLCIAGKMDSI